METKIIPIYTALFVENPAALLEKFPPKHAKTFAHHSTIAFKPGSLEGITMGEKSQIKIIGRAFDEKGDALLVENPKSKNAHPHITLSCAEGVPPFYSEKLLEHAFISNSIQYFDSPELVDVVEGYSDGKNDFVKAFNSAV